MILTEVILRLREHCPSLKRRVGGTAKFSKSTEMNEAKIGVPCAFVMPQGTQAQPRTNEDSTNTLVTERVAVMVAVDNTIDRSRGGGVSAVDALRGIESELYNALVGWRPLLLNDDDLKVTLHTDHGQKNNNEFLAMAYGDMQKSSAGTFNYSESTHISMSSARLWHQFEFTITYPMFGVNKNPDGMGETLKKIYGGWYDKIGYAHIDDYELIVPTPDGAIGVRPYPPPNKEKPVNLFALAGAANDWRKWDHSSNRYYWGSGLTQAVGEVNGERCMIGEATNTRGVSTYLYIYRKLGFTAGKHYTFSIWLRSHVNTDAELTFYVNSYKGGKQSEPWKDRVFKGDIKKLTDGWVQYVWTFLCKDDTPNNMGGVVLFLRKQPSTSPIHWAMPIMVEGDLTTNEVQYAWVEEV